MIKTMLTKADLNYLLTQQEKLDKDIRNKKDISKEKWLRGMRSKHALAVDVEIHEFINECHDLWKYWKSKPVNKSRIIEEAIDVIHFLMLHHNKMFTGIKVVDSMHIKLKICDANFHDLPVDDEALEQLTLSDRDIVFQLYIVLKVLDHYGFTDEDIIAEYNAKNKVNFERLANGY